MGEDRLNCKRGKEMKLGVLTALFQDQSLEKALDIIAELTSAP